MRRMIVLAMALMLASVLTATPASATVHEIVGQWCSGRAELFPPGISSGGSNQARPLFANGFASIVDPFDPPGAQEEGVLIAFDFDHPASKIRSLGFFVQIGQTDDERPLYVEAFELDTARGFAHCARLR